MRLRDAHLHCGDPVEMKQITDTSPLRDIYPCYRMVQYGRMDDYPGLFQKAGYEAVSVVPSVFREQDPTRESLRAVELAASLPELYPFAVLDEENPAFVAEHYRELAGVKEHIVLHKSELSPAKEELFALMERHGLTLLLHSEAKRRVSYVKSILARFPRLKIQVAHLGRAAPGDTDFILEIMRSFKGCENVFFDTSTVRDPDVLTQSVSVVGAERILYGSDFPFFMDEAGEEDIIGEQIGHVLKAKLTDDARDKIFYRNHITYITKGA